MRRRRSLTMRINQFLQDGERQLIRVIILGSVILVIMQLSLAKDPVQFYLAMAQKVESPSIDLNTARQASTLPTPQTPAVTTAVSLNSARVWQITLKATPNMPVRVLQNGKVLGNLAKGEQVFALQTGIVQLDATNVKQSVRVQVIKREQLLNQPNLNQVFYLDGNVQEIWVGP
ncbi:MAG: hypothetical protein WA131_06515 [Desulfitobacteriaceae bacterium]